MYRKLLFLVLALGFCLTSLGRAANETIIWVSDSNVDSEFTDLLKAEGWIIDRHNEDLQGPLDQAELNMLNAARLVIVSRATGFMSEANVSVSSDTSQYLEPDDWNSIRAPVLLMSTHLAKPTAWKWFPSSDDANTDRSLIVEDPTHPVFDGFTVSEGDAIAFLDNTPRRTTMALRPNANEGSNGQLIATRNQRDRIWIVFWEKGVEFYKGSGQFAGGPRLFLSSGVGYRPQDGPPGSYNLAEGGNKVYLNAVRYMISLGHDITLAFNESPENGATDVNRNVILSWKPGDFTVTNNVYFGISSENVNNASVSDARGVLLSQGLNANTFDPGRLNVGETYFWRIDGVNDLESGSPWKGDVWSFTAEPVCFLIADVNATASSSFSANNGPEKTVDGSGLDAEGLHGTEETTMWMSGLGDNEPRIQYEFNKAYVLHEIRIWNSNQTIEPLFGVGAKEVVIETSLDGATWTALSPDPIQINRAPGQLSPVNSVVAPNATLARYVRISVKSNWGGLFPQGGLSEVQFCYLPVRARRPVPADGSTVDDIDVTLSWRAGRGSVSHQVSLGTDPDALALVATVAAPDRSLDISDQDLQYDATYAWQVHEDTGAAVYEGDVWRFTTPPSFIVDNFELYDNDCQRIFFAWQDGLGHNGNEDCGVAAFNGNGTGSIVGNASAPFAERSIVHSGRQSMPLEYNGASEATLTLDDQNWQAHGLKTLVLYFRGEEGNTGQLYVKINDIKIDYQQPAGLPPGWNPWNQWNIDLNSVGTDLTKVKSFNIGIEGAGAQGKTYVDDILIYKDGPTPPQVFSWFEAESADTLTLPLEIMDDATASGGKHIGTLNGVGNSNSEPPLDGIATYTLTVPGGTYKLSGRVNTEGGNSFWVRIQGATIPAETELHASGWVRWNDPPAALGWNWIDIFSDDDDQGATVLFTMDAGTYTLEIARREDGALLDAIALVKTD